MPNYRRLISYIYAYEGGVKGKNIGFAKIESRGIQCKITVNVKKIYVGSNDTGVYLLTGDQEIFLGNIFIRGGSGEFRTVVSVSDVEHSGISMDDCFGLTVHDVENTWRSYTTIWEDAVAHAAEVELAEAASVGKTKEEEAETVSVEKLKEAVRQIEEEFPAEPVSPEKPSYIPAVEFAAELAPELAPELASGLAPELASELTSETQAVLEQMSEPGPTPVREPSRESEPVEEPSSDQAPVSEPPYVMESIGSPSASEEEKVSSVYQQPSEILRNQPARQAAILGKTSYYGKNPESVQSSAEVLNQGTENQTPGYRRQNPGSGWQNSGTVYGRWENTQSEAEEVNRGEEERWGMDGSWNSGNFGYRDSGNSGYQDAGNSGYGNHVFWEQPVLSGYEPAQETPEPARETPGPLQETPEPFQETPEPLQETPEPPQPMSEETPPVSSLTGSMNEESAEVLIHDKIWENLKREHTKITAFDYEKGCEILTIKPQDIGLLPREIWVYGNNSFLLHGYYNYRYLILARLNNPGGMPRYLLGVPGHYYSNERYMASMFGFPNFVLSKDQPMQDGRFGYWYTDVKLQDMPEEDQ